VDEEGTILEEVGGETRHMRARAGDGMMGVTTSTMVTTNKSSTREWGGDTASEMTNTTSDQDDHVTTVTYMPCWNIQS
jgi:hypothetical protein